MTGQRRSISGRWQCVRRRGDRPTTPLRVTHITNRDLARSPTQPHPFMLQFIQREKLPGVLFITDHPKVSVFTLTNLLNTTPEMLMNWLEDDALADLIEEVDEDEWFEGEEGKKVYESFVNKSA